jgi:hypothetical protein
MQNNSSLIESTVMPASNIRRKAASLAPSRLIVPPSGLHSIFIDIQSAQVAKMHIDYFKIENF